MRLGGRGAFGDLTLGSQHFKGFDASSFVVGTGIAYQVALNAKGTIQFCPHASLGFNIGPNNIQGSGIDYGASAWALGGGIGVLATHSGQTDLMPTLSFGFVHATERLTNNNTGATTSASQSFEFIDLGVGLVHKHQLALRPIVSIPLGLPGGTIAFTVALNYSLGHAE